MLLLITPIGRMGFNPRTRVECDSPAALVWAASQRFNPRTRVECDLYYQIVFQTTNVSIRALAWSAMQRSQDKDRIPPSFNPRTRVECDSQLCVN